MLASCPDKSSDGFHEEETTGTHLFCVEMVVITLLEGMSILLEYKATLNSLYK